MLIAFDLDGTLIDSLGLTMELLLAAAHAITGNSLRPDEVSDHYGHPEERMTERMFKDDQKIATRVFHHYIAGLKARKDQVSLFLNVAEGLTALSAETAKLQNGRASLALYTARGRQATEVLFEQLGMARWFQNWVTGSDVVEGKPNPEGLEFLLRATGAGDPVYYIGDSAKDVLMAKSIGATAIGVTWCVHCDKGALAESGPDFVFDDPRELFNFLIERVRAL